MPFAKTSTDQNIARFWERYQEKLRERRVKQTAMRWYVLRAEEYIKATQDKRLKTQDATDVTRYLEKMGRKDRIPDWQFRQIVDAIQAEQQGVRSGHRTEMAWLPSLPWPSAARWLSHTPDSSVMQVEEGFVMKGLAGEYNRYYKRIDRSAYFFDHSFFS